MLLLWSNHWNSIRYFFSDNYYVKFNVLRAMQQQQLPSYAGKQKVKGETVAITQGL